MHIRPVPSRTPASTERRSARVRSINSSPSRYRISNAINTTGFSRITKIVGSGSTDTLTGPLALAQSASIFGLWGLTFIAVAAFASPATLTDDRAETRWPWLPADLPPPYDDLMVAVQISPRRYVGDVAAYLFLDGHVNTLSFAKTWGDASTNLHYPFK